MRTSWSGVLAATMLVCAACSTDGADPAPPDDTVSPTASAEATHVPSEAASHPDDPTSKPAPESTSRRVWLGEGLQPVAARSPQPLPETAFVALEDGRLVEVDVASGEVVHEITSFLDPSEVDEDSEGYGMGPYLDDVAVTPDRSLLVVDLCCEPAAGNLVLVDPVTGDRGLVFIGIAPAVRTDGRWVVSTPLSQVISVDDLTGKAAPRLFPLVLPTPIWEVGRPAWSPDGMHVAVAVRSSPSGEAGIVVIDLAVPIDDFDEAVFHRAPAGLSWAAPAFRADGLLLVAEQEPQRHDRDDEGPATGVVLDPSTGDRVTSYPLDGRVWFQRYDATHTWLLVGYDDGRIDWQGGGRSGTLIASEGYAAAW